MSENKITSLIYKLIFGLMIFSFAYFAYKAMQKAQKPGIQTNKEICLKDKKSVFSGTVIELKWSRGTYLAKLDNGNFIEWWCKSKVRDVVGVGDSIYKPSGTFDTYIFKNANPDSVIFIECDFDCDYWEKRYGKE